MIEIIKERQPWNEFVNGFVDADVYHTFDYHQVSRSSNEEPVLICYRDEKHVIGLPLLFRKIPNTEYSDATSVYGYPGPLCRTCSTAPVNHEQFRSELNTLFRQQKIVSVFSRLHPFIAYQHDVLKHMGDIYSPGKVVFIALNKSLDDQKSDYNKRLRTYINKCRRVYDFKAATTEKEIKEFVSMYEETMRRVDARKKYFFDLPYFKRFMAAQSFEKELLLAIDKESAEIAAGAIFIYKNRMVNYHLSGVKENYLKLNPIKMLIDVSREKATADKYSFFNLGGGVGNKEDSLFYFKSGYSNSYNEFRLWRYIVDINAYDYLVEAHFGKVLDEEERGENDFFPLYRSERRDNHFNQ